MGAGFQMVALPHTKLRAKFHRKTLQAYQVTVTAWRSHDSRMRKIESGDHKNCAKWRRRFHQEVFAPLAGHHLAAEHARQSDSIIANVDTWQIVSIRKPSGVRQNSPSWISPRPSEIALPISREISAPSSSLCFARRLLMVSRTEPLSGAGTFLKCLYASCALLTTSSIAPEEV